MARKSQLRDQRAGTIINRTSTVQEKEIDAAIVQAFGIVAQEERVKLVHQKQLNLKVIVEKLQANDQYADIDFHHHFDTSSMKPDGGILSVQDVHGELYPILIAEVKNQGTNDLRAQEGKPKQASGNAIERLGKNVIGFRTWLLDEDIFPFVCFGYGWDFKETSSILDRVTTINMFGPLNTFAVQRQGPNGEFQRGCMYFRQEKWSVDEMLERILPVMRYSIRYYKKKYGSEHFEFQEPSQLTLTMVEE